MDSLWLVTWTLLACSVLLWRGVLAQDGISPPLPDSGVRLYQGLENRMLPDFAMVAARGVQQEDIGDPDGNGAADGINDGLWCQSAVAASGTSLVQATWYRPDGQRMGEIDGPLTVLTAPGQVGFERLGSIRASPYQGMYTCAILDEYGTNQTLVAWLGSNDAYFPLGHYPSPDPSIEPISVKLYPPTHSRDQDPPEFMLSFAVTNAPPTFVTCELLMGITVVDIELSSLSRRVLDGQYIVNENGTIEETVRTEVNVTIQTRQAGDYTCTISVFRANQPSAVPLTKATTPIVTVTVTGTPRNVTVMKVTVTSVLVSWSPPASNTPAVEGYEVFYQIESGNRSSGDGLGGDYVVFYWGETGGRMSGGETNASQLSLVVTGLVSTLRYSFFVVAFGGDLPSAPSSIAIVSPAVVPVLENGQGTVFNRETGQSVSFNCTADGIPVPVIAWRRNGQLLLSSVRYSEVITDPAPGFRSEDLPGVLQVTSILTVTSLKSTDQGTYSCRADNGEGDGVVMEEPYQLTVTEPSTPNPCTSASCQHGGTCFQTDDKDAGYICSCTDAYTGSHCEQRVVLEVAPEITQPPVDTSAVLYSEVVLRCLATGSPQPGIKWYKNGAKLFEDADVDSPTLIVPEMSISDRGFYYCVASNSAGSMVSSTVVLNIKGLVQYEGILLLSDTFYNSKRKRQEEDQIQQLLTMMNELIVGKPVDGAVVFSVTPKEITSTNLTSLSIIVTILSEMEGNRELLIALQDTLVQVIDLLPGIAIDPRTVHRFDGCEDDVTYIESSSGRPDLRITLNWTETNLGEVAFVNCPCGGNLTTSSLQASRYCTGSFEEGAYWNAPDDGTCNFSDLAREVCLLSDAETDEKVRGLENITASSENFDSVEVSVSAEVLITTSEDVAGNEELTQDFLNVVSNLLEVDESVLQDSQETSNTSAMLLESLEVITESIPIPENSTEPVVITQPAFAVSVQEVEPESFSGFTFSAAIDGGSSGALGSDSLSFGENVNGEMGPVMSSMSLPANLFQSVPVTNATRITQSVFVNDALFLRRNVTIGQQEVGSIVLAAEVVGSQIRGLDPPITLTFLKNQNLNGRDPSCQFWNPQLDEGYGDWSTEGCVRGDYNESDAHVTCYCTHLSSFTILLDVSPEVAEPNSTSNPLQLALAAVSYIGAIISIVCLLLTFISYLSLKKLRSSPHGQLLLNLCLSLSGLYAMFICAIHSPPIPALCAVVAALLQYFFLVTFMIMAAEAINLYMKLVIILGKGVHDYVLKAALTSWLTPLFVVIFCFAPDYENYISDHFCRAFGIPFYVGTIAPFVVIYIFNWIMYVIILGSLFCKARPGVEKKSVDRKKLKQQFMIAITLSLLFGLGWGVGLPATQALYIAPIRDMFSILFIVLTAFQGLFVFLMHTLRSKEVRNLWKSWLFCKKEVTTKSSAAYSTTSRDLRQQESFPNTRSLSISSVSKGTIVRKVQIPDNERKMHETTTFTSIEEEPSIESSENEDLKLKIASPTQTSLMPLSLVDTIMQRQQRLAEGNVEDLVDEEESHDQTHPIPDHVFDIFDKVSLGEKNTSDNVFFNLPAGACDLDASSVLSFESEPETGTVLPNPALSEGTVLPNPALSDETWL